MKNYPQFFTCANQTFTRFLSGPLSFESSRKIMKILQENKHASGHSHSQSTRAKISQAIKATRTMGSTARTQTDAY